MALHSSDCGWRQQGSSLWPGVDILWAGGELGGLKFTHRQIVHHDLWDFDAAQPVMLFTWNVIPAIHGTTKAGYDFILDRASGETLFPYQEVAAPPAPAAVAAYAHPWPTQPVSSIESLARFTVDPASVPPGAVAVPEFTPPSPTAQVYQPGFVAGYEWFPAAYSPRTHMIYSPAIYHP